MGRSIAYLGWIACLALAGSALAAEPGPPRLAPSPAFPTGWSGPGPLPAPTEYARIGEAEADPGPPAPKAPLPDTPKIISDTAPLRPASGRLLIATRRMHGPFFARTVILLLEYSPGGAMGLILNRPTSAILGEVLPEAGEYVGRRDRIRVGGPVEPRCMTFLYRSDEVHRNSLRIIEDVYVTSGFGVLRRLLSGGIAETRLHIYAGYSGWGPRQLDMELARGDWYVATARAREVFDAEPGSLWERSVAEFEGTQVRRSDPGAGMARR